MTFGKRLKSFRLEKNMSQQDLAEKLNVTPQAVSKWENDISEPEFQIIKEITQIYKVSFDRLFQDDEKSIYKGLIIFCLVIVTVLWMVTSVSSFELDHT